MGSKQLCLLSLLVALVVGLVIGCTKEEPQAKAGGEEANTSAALPPPPPPIPTPHAQPFVIRVGPKAADVNPPSVTLHKSKNEQAIWVLVEGAGHNSLPSTGELYIEFEDAQLFLDEDANKQPNGRYRVACQGIVCQSGPINPNAPEGKHKYWQHIPGATPPDADGMVIIDK
jgi:hypothetical protein